MIDYEAKAEAIWQEVLRFRARVVGGYDIPDDWTPPKDAIAAFGRECAAQAYEDAANISAGANHLGVVKIQLAIRAKASALRQPISVTQEEEGK